MNIHEHMVGHCRKLFSETNSPSNLIEWIEYFMVIFLLAMFLIIPGSLVLAGVMFLVKKVWN